MKYPAIFAATLTLTFSQILTAAPGWISESSSAFIREHANSAVDWMPWGEEAFKKAADEGRPVFIHVGYYTSELSRAMAAQTFSNPETVKVLNEEFVSILVDRAQQPEVADLHQAWLRFEKQVSGWPINIWLTPEMKPIEGAAYLPPSEEWGQPGFINVLERTFSAWQSDPDGQRARADDSAAALADAAEPASDPLSDDDLKSILESGIESWSYGYDADNKVLGDPPQYLQPELLTVLMMQGGDSRDMAIAIHNAMLDGGVRDPIGGGFFRQAVLGNWKYPYFQKTLTDQARMVHGLLDAAKETGDARFKEAATETLDFVLRELGDPSSGFVSAIDATAPEHFTSYLWTTEEVKDAVGKKNAAEINKAFGLTDDGNIAPDTYLGVDIAGKNIPMRASAGTSELISEVRAKLLEVRSGRAAPLKDTLATSGAHGLLLGALARAGKELDNDKYTAAAKQLVDFIKSDMTADGQLLRLRGGNVSASPLDLALVANGLLWFSDAMGDESAKEWAVKLQTQLDDQFLDKDSGRYFISTEETKPGVWVRAHVPAPGKGEPASVEAVSTLNWVLVADSDNSAPIAQAIALGIEESYDPPRGGDLLALELFLKD